MFGARKEGTACPERPYAVPSVFQERKAQVTVRGSARRQAPWATPLQSGSPACSLGTRLTASHSRKLAWARSRSAAEAWTAEESSIMAASFSKASSGDANVSSRVLVM